jgi:hypothetical protein
VSIEIPEEVKEAMFSAWLPALMTSMLKEVNALPDEHRRKILTAMCTTCEDLAIAGAVGCQPGMSWDAYVEFLKGTVPPVGPWTVKQEGDTYDLIYDASIGEDGKPRCHCPLVLLGIMGPNPECCESGARLAGRMIEGATRKEISSTEVIDSPCRTGASVCHYRVRTLG